MSAPDGRAHTADYPEHTTVRQLCWIRQATVTIQLNGPQRELKRTVKFILETVLQI